MGVFIIIRRTIITIIVFASIRVIFMTKTIIIVIIITNHIIRKSALIIEGCHTLCLFRQLI